MIAVLIAVLAIVAWAGSPSVGAPDLAKLISGDDSVRIIENGPESLTLEVDGRSEWSPGSTLTLTTEPSTWAVPRVISRSFYVFMGVQHPDAEVIDQLAGYAREIIERDDGSFGPGRKPFRGEALPGELLIAVALGVPLATTLLVASKSRVIFQFRLPHVVPTAIQTALFVYWWLYWPGVGQRVPSILLQIVLAYAMDAMVSLPRERVWRVGLGPLPIVLSANLFAWFAPLGTIVVVVTALASRAFIRRGGRHLLNPSAAGLTLAGLLSLASPAIGYEPTFHTLNLAPNMAEVIVLLTLIPQIRFRLVLVSVGAVIGLALAAFAFHNFPALGFPGTLITFALFATDPATIPRTPLGQLLFGATVGAGMAVFSTCLTAAGYPDVFSKVFPVPIANLLVPRFDALGERFGSPRLSFLALRWNPAHVALWLCLVVPPICTEKRAQFLIAPHWNYATPLVAYRSVDALRCEDNPIFCRPFTFAQEISQWMARKPSGHQ